MNYMRTGLRFLLALFASCLIVSCSTNETQPESQTAPAALMANEVCEWRCQVERMAETDPLFAMKKLETMSDENREIGTNCHDAAHNIGRMATILTGVDEAFRTNSPACGGGYWHGVVTEWVFQGHNVSELADKCTATGQGVLSIWECGHGIGHALVLQDGTQKAMLTCDSFPGSVRSGCWHGGLMQNFIDNPRDLPFEACANYTGIAKDEYLKSCYSLEGVRFSLGDGVKDLSTPDKLRGAIDNCISVKDAFLRAQCSGGVGSGVADSSSPEILFIHAACKSLKGDTQVEDWCWEGVGRNMVANLGNVEKALAFCKQLAKDNHTYQRCEMGAELTRSSVEPGTSDIGMSETQAKP